MPFRSPKADSVALEVGARKDKMYCPSACDNLLEFRDARSRRSLAYRMVVEGLLGLGLRIVARK